MDESARGDRILGLTRILAGIVVPILAVAFLMLYFFPDDSGKLFAWPIKPHMSAMMLGATYLGGVYFFSKVVIARRWHAIRLGFIPVSAFAGILGLATILHWDKFTPGHISFRLWAFLYFTLPVIIPLVWLRNERFNRGFRLTEPTWSGLLRISFAVLGALMVIASLLLFFLPEVMIDTWGWTLTPLTARTLAAMFMLPGLVGLGIAWDGHWSSAVTILQAQIVSIVLILLAAFLNRTEITWGQWGSWFFLGGLLLVLTLIGWAHFASRWRS